MSRLFASFTFSGYVTNLHPEIIVFNTSISIIRIGVIYLTQANIIIARYKKMLFELISKYEIRTKVKCFYSICS